MTGRKLLIENVHIPGIETFDVYRKNGGYASVEKALKKIAIFYDVTPQNNSILHEVAKLFLSSENYVTFSSFRVVKIQ
jgi:hypothetical protein